MIKFVVRMVGKSYTIYKSIWKKKLLSIIIKNAIFILLFIIIFIKWESYFWYVAKFNTKV